MPDWSSYLADFHAERAGVTEQVLTATLAGNHDPYKWLARSVSASARLVLDVGCGSGAMARELADDGRTVVGIDISSAELALARERGASMGAGVLVQADGRALPFADGTFDAVVTTLGLAVIEPTSTLLDEVCRVLRPGGVMVGLVPTVRPLKPADVRAAGQLTRLLQSTPQFPAQIELTAGKLLTAHGLRKVEDARERYHYAVRTREDAELLLRSFYLPEVGDDRLQKATEWMVEQASRHGELQVPMPLRRLVAIK